MPTCAIYARVSDESQVRGGSIQHQISFCQEVARRREMEGGETWRTPDEYIYVDEGITGTNLVKRREVQRLIQDARMGRFDVVMFKGISRFARDTVDALIMLRTLLACQVRVISIEENYDSWRDNAEFTFTIHSALAQAESEKTAVRVRLGAVQKARDGKWNGPAPDGYILNRATQKLEIDESMAPIIRRIFGLYESGCGTRSIANQLNEAGHWTKRGNRWSPRTIARILANPVYAGHVAYGRRERRLEVSLESDLLSRKKRTTWVKDAVGTVMCRHAHDAIIDEETFARAAAVRAKRQAVPGRSAGLHILSKGLLKCGCGGNMVAKYNARQTRYYRCTVQRDSGREACGQSFVRANEVERAVLQQVRTDLMNNIGWADAPVPQARAGPCATPRTLLHTVLQLLKDPKSNPRMAREVLERLVSEIVVNGETVSITYRFRQVACLEQI